MNSTPVGHIVLREDGALYFILEIPFKEQRVLEVVLGPAQAADWRDHLNEYLALVDEQQAIEELLRTEPGGH